MAPSRVVPLVLFLVLASVGGASAQLTGQIPGVTDQQPPSQQAPPSQQVPPCLAAFRPLKEEAEKRAMAIRDAAERHKKAAARQKTASAGPEAPPEAARAELCKLFTNFAEAEGRMVRYLEQNAAKCGIPPQAVTGGKTNHARTVDTKKRICAAATGPAAPDPRRNPGLGDALGMRGVPTQDTTTTGGGTLDSLGGNPLAR